MDKKKEYKEYINDILKKLKSINPKIVMVFGSYTNRKLTEDSDLDLLIVLDDNTCLLYTSPSPRDLSTSRMPSSA